jgi:nucleotide-binding universal stress UspA family protein
MKRILVGLDGSARAPSVLATAVTIARAQGAKLWLLRAVGVPPEIPQDSWKMTDEPLVDVLRRRALEYLNEMRATVPPELVDATDVEIGVAWQAICAAAKRQQADLVVVGSHGYTGLDHLLGTTAAKVVNHATCSVLVVRS